MNKIKFTVSGMHCYSCAALIENNLKDKPGVISAKISFDSKKGSIAFDEQKINQPEIIKAIEQTGDYKVNDIQGGEEEKEAEPRTELRSGTGAETEPALDRPDENPPVQNSGFSKGLLIGLLIFSAILNIYLLEKSGAPKAAILPAKAIPYSSPSPSPSAPAIQNFDITSANQVRGDFNAPITLVEFSDFECPFCQRHLPTLQKILTDYPQKVRLVYKQFPLSLHPNSQKAAEASECAAEQGKFWEYHDQLFQNQTVFSADNFKKWAGELNLNQTQFNNCLDSNKYYQKVQDDLQEGVSKGVRGTPTTFINGQSLVGAQPYETFKEIIDKL